MITRSNTRASPVSDAPYLMSPSTSTFHYMSLHARTIRELGNLTVG